jgi:transcriptional regulator with XRE-family HTH domain
MTSGKVSERIRRLMAEKQISREDLAARSGLNREFLNQLAAMDGFPSLGPMLKIARALGVRLGTLIDDQMSPDPLITRRDAPREEIRMLPDKDKPPALKFYSLGKGKTDRHMEPFFIEILPESAQDKKLSSHEGEEFIIVVSGRVELIYGKETSILEAGDSVYYNSVVPHCVSCADNAPAAIYAVLYIPE